MRLRAVLTAGCLTASLLAASLLATTVPAAAVLDQPTQVSITKAKAQKLAKAGVLTAKDLKGFRVETSEPNPDEIDAAVYECVGAKIPKYAAENPGRSFEKRALTIDSSAFVVATKKAAKADYKAFMTKKGDACLAKFFRQAFEAEGATVDSVKVRRFAVSVPGADVAFGQRFVLSGFFGEFPFLVIGLNVNALVGQTELAVGPTRFDGREPNLKQAKALTVKLVKRVAAV